MSHYLSLAPLAITVTSAAVVLGVVIISLHGTEPGDRARVLQAVAEVIRALRGRP